MRRAVRSIVASAVACFALALPPATAGGAAAQETTGSVAVPVRFPADATYSSWPGGHRNGYNATQGATNGITGYVFPIQAKIAGGRFSLELTDGATGREDLDITFYTSLDPSVSPGASAEHGKPGESGIVPEGSNFGLVTLFDGAQASFVFRGFTPVKKPAAALGLPPLPSAPGVYPNFGKGSASQWAQRLKSRSHVVIALVDTGINPYHVAFKSPEYAVHPSEYVEGYPAGTPALGLTLDETDYVKARNADEPAVWSKVTTKKLYWIPGTNIIGAYSVFDVFDTTPVIGSTLPEGIEQSRPILDDHLHGTGVSSVSAGISISPTRKEPFGSNPEALIVMVEGFGDEAIKWVSEQPWIDFVSGSYGDPAAVPYTEAMPDIPAQPDPVGDLDGREYRWSAPFVLRDGRTACFSAGNGLSRTGIAVDRYSSIRPTSGPSWVVTVGATSPRNDQDYGWHSIPVDVSSYGNYWAAAAPFSTDGEQTFSGTSNATPVTCGVMSKVLLEARRALGDAREGIHIRADGEPVPALGPKGLAAGLLADGDLTRPELQDAIFKTAAYAAFDPDRHSYDPISIPDNPAIHTQQGYGLVNVASGKRAADVVFGRAAMPDRATVDAWVAQLDSIRNVFWPPPAYERTPPKTTPPPQSPPQKNPPKVAGKKYLPSTGVGDASSAAIALLALALVAGRLASSPRSRRSATD